jgi:arabinoxylan arabinofuranohydrolase
MKSIFKIVLYSLLCAFSLSAQKKDFKGYLFAYFEGKGPAEKQEQLRFAVSDDAVNWKALNNNEPIIPSKDIAATGGIRDPHILRGTVELNLR